MAAVADSWEEMDDARVVEEHLKKLNVSNSRKSPGPSDGPVSVIVQDDNGRTPYRPDGPPQVRILKRSENPANGLMQKQPQNVKPIKTYQERHAEYQEMRLRIMGKTEDPEPEDVPLPSSMAMTTAPPPLHASHSSPALSTVSFINYAVRTPSISMMAAPPGGLHFPPPMSVEQNPFCVPPPRTPQLIVNNHNNYQKPELVMPREGGRISVLRPGETWPSSTNPALPVPLLRTPKGPDGSQGFRNSYR